MENKESCCKASNNAGKKGFLQGIIYGILPHTFCIAFVIFSVFGVTAIGVIFKNILLIPYFFQFLVVTSFVFATISVIFYLKTKGCLCFSGIKNKWRYITILYSVTILVNLSMFFLVFPALANINYNKPTVGQGQLEDLVLVVQIPCSGHALLIIDELKKIDGVNDVKFKIPNVFEIKYDPAKTSSQKIILLEIFKTYKATIQ
jgi:hypothetical protein